MCVNSEDPEKASGLWRLNMLALLSSCKGYASPRGIEIPIYYPRYLMSIMKGDA